MRFSKSRRWVLGGICGFVAQPVWAAGAGLTGHYQVSGKNPDGTSYSGVAWIEDVAGNVSITWEISGRRFEGRGVIQGTILTVDWGDTTPVIYQVLDGGKTLYGTWSNGRALDILTRSP